MHIHQKPQYKNSLKLNINNYNFLGSIFFLEKAQTCWFMIQSSKFIIEYRHIFLSFLLHKKTYIDTTPPQHSHTHMHALKHHSHAPTHSHTTRMHPRIHAHSFTCTHASTHTRSLTHNWKQSQTFLKNTFLWPSFSICAPSKILFRSSGSD